ncbi:hypothetical protein [Schinkia azotoformans]|uniref:hypothetical protein n=1 Tax=Schinkia azotoformans TaxID=1454 RepID=UPI002DB69EBD|nr:hypothetical protein [Schinkia azotoformans]MEC1744125.1 hypothetical protein [Schinkia azotoformans]
MKGYKVLKPLRHNKTRYDVGAFINAEKVNEQDAKRLLNLKVVEPAVKDETLQTIVPDISEVTEGLNVLGEEKEPIEETLDLNFNTDELKDGARELGLDFKNNIRKSELIQLILDSKNEQYFLDQLED